MQTRKVVENQIGGLSDLRSIVDIYKEIAATRITRTRTSVLKRHKFLGEINEIFQQVKSSYRREVERLMRAKKTKDPSKISFVKKNGKTVLVFLSANAGLYGNIVSRTFELFLEEAKRGNYDLVVIGKLGRFMIQDSEFKNYKYFDLPDQTVEEDKIREIALFLIQYEKIVVFYQQFQTLVNQEPVFSDISGNTGLAQTPATSEVVKYLFEPSLEKVLEFFEKEIFSSIFEQTIRDSQLSKFASRLVTLDAASENIKKKLSVMVFEAIRLRHREKNKNQNQMYSSMSLWS